MHPDFSGAKVILIFINNNVTKIKEVIKMRLFTFLSIMVFSAAIFVNAQIPNPDFESWDNGSVDNWWTDNVPPTLVPVTKTSDSQSGSFAVKGEVVNFNGTNIPPVLNAGASSASTGFSISERYGSIQGYYKFTSSDGNRLAITAEMLKDGNYIGTGAITPDASSEYKQFTLNVNYGTSDVPDECRISITIVPAENSNGVNNGSVMYIDDLSFGEVVTEINDDASAPVSYKLYQNYPNPFNPSTKIKYSLPGQGMVKLNIYNILGKKVKTLVDGSQNRGGHVVTAKLNDFASGIYIYRLDFSGENSKSFSSIKKMILLR